MYIHVKPIYGLSSWFVVLDNINNKSIRGPQGPPARAPAA